MQHYTGLSLSARAQAAVLAEGRYHESRAQHYAMAVYYTRLADVKQKSARATNWITGEASGNGPAPLTK